MLAILIMYICVTYIYLVFLNNSFNGNICDVYMVDNILIVRIVM